MNDNFHFMIVGAGRGGTSLLAGLLDAHPALEVGFELFSVDYLMGQALTPPPARIFQERTAAFVSACNRAAADHPGVLWGNKITTEQIFGLEDHNGANPGSQIDVLDAFFNSCLKEKKILFILRDGRTCVNSKVSRTGQPYETACERWKYSVRVFDFLRSRQNTLCVKYEDLLKDPESLLTSIAHFLGVPYSNEMLKGTNNEKMLPEYRQGQVDKSKMEAITLRNDHLMSIYHDLRHCGYI